VSARYRVEVAAEVAKQLRRVPRTDVRRIYATIELLADTPRPPGAKPLKGPPGRWRVRVGDYRIIYRINDDVLLVLVLAAQHRKDVYR
jgi:mRNA interferase RelE/StbE